MPFDEPRALDAIDAFRRARDVGAPRTRVITRLERAMDISWLKGSDAAWQTIPFWTADDDPGHTLFGYQFRTVVNDRPQRIFDRVLQVETAKRRVRTTAWLESNAVVPVSRWARFSRAMRDAQHAGLGWVIPVRGELLLVPVPEVRTAEGRPDVLHDDTGRPAIEWLDGAGTYFLNGTEFAEGLYHRVIGSELLIQEIAALDDADRRAIALSYLSFEALVVDSDADLLDVGLRGTRLYRLPLPPRIRADRLRGYGLYDYFIHMRDASHPEREFIEWVDPVIGRQRNAELCQANAFGISLNEWLSIEQEG